MAETQQAPDPFALLTQMAQLNKNLEALSAKLEKLEQRTVTRLELYLTLLVIVMGAVIIILLAALFLRGG